MKTKIVTIRVYEIGDKFRLGLDTYLLTYLGDNNIGLVNTRSGHLWDDPIKVKCSSSITEDELAELVDNDDALEGAEYIGNNIG